MRDSVSLFRKKISINEPDTACSLSKFDPLTKGEDTVKQKLTKVTSGKQKTK